MPEQPTPPHIIDLRRRIEPPSHKRSFLRGRVRTRPYLHQVRMRIQWSEVRREMWKYGLAVLVIAIPIGIAVGVWNIHRIIDSVSYHVTTGLQRAADGYAALNERHVPAAQESFVQSQAEFAAAEAAVKRSSSIFGGVDTKLPWIGPRLRAAMSAIDAAQQLATASRLVADHLPSTGTWDSFDVSTKGVISGSFGALQPLAKHPEVLDDISAALLQAYRDVQSIPLDLIPSSYRQQAEPILSLLPSLFGTPDQAGQLLTVVREMLGTPYAKEYLVLFQNDDEIRATGGFPGTFLLVKFDHGTFTITDAPGNGPYNLRDHVGKGTLPPQPIFAIAPYWAFQDSTWFADVPTSASAALDFYEQARGFRPSGVFFVTPHLVERLLAITGPITLTDKDKTEVNATTFVRQIEEQVELKYDKSLNAPKSVLINVVPELLNRLLHLPTGKGLLALTTFFDEFQRSNMSLVSEVPKVAEALTKLHWTGALGTDREKTFSIVRSNLGGGKSDRAVSETDTIRYVPQGTEWQVTVTIAREHFGDPADKLHGTTNRVFFRVFTDPRARLVSLEGESVPTGLFLPPAKGATNSTIVQKNEGEVLVNDDQSLRITHESGYAVYGFWSLLPAGKQQTIQLTYALPRDEQSDFQLWLRKQPGINQAKWQLQVADSSLQPLASDTSWVKKEGVWQWNGLATYNEIVRLEGK